MDNYHKVLEALINKSIVNVACLVEDRDVILGYSILSTDEETVHWCFVKSAFRNRGISKDLLPSNIATFTHFSTVGLDIAKKHPDCVFNPFCV